MSYEVAFRKRILKCFDEGKSMAEIARLFDISVSSIKRWRKKQESGSLKDPVRKRSFQKIDPAKLEAYVLEHPDAYLSEIAEVFQCATSSVHAALAKLGFTHKKKSTAYREQDQKKLKPS